MITLEGNYLSLEEAASRIGISHRSAQWHARLGQLRTVRAGQKLCLVPESEVERFRQEENWRGRPKAAKAS